jgi:cytochrome c biogenesis protein CcmG, thiol:disulfide interchange protein DsbE
VRTQVGRVWACLLACAFGCGACDDGPDAVAPPSAARLQAAPLTAAEPAPTLPEGLITIDAAALRARARDGKLRGLVVNVWASWCGSCREEIPLLMQLREGFVKEGIDMLFVSADEPKAYASALELMKSIHGPLPMLAIAEPLKTFKPAMNPNWHGGVPATFLFDHAGKLRHFWEGPILEEEIAPVLQGFLAGDAIDGETRTTGAPQ